ncbi:MAG: hypothetical protein HFJ80_03255 [Clostridiales bacterium]|nr:hypothetical protein [Clostridiales bacterium]
MNFVAFLPAAGLFPATGESVNPWPYILMGVGVVLLIALIVLQVVSSKQKKEGEAPREKTASAPPVPAEPAPAEKERPDEQDSAVPPSDPPQD